MADFNFDREHDISGNNFIRTNKDALNTLFGGEDISPFWIADMEYAIDQHIIDEIKRVADRGVFSYEKPLDDFYPIICTWFKERHGIMLEPKRFEIVTGVLTGIAVLIQEFSNEGDEVIIQNPGIPCVQKSLLKVITEQLLVTLCNWLMVSIEWIWKIWKKSFKALRLRSLLFATLTIQWGVFGEKKS